MKFKAEIYSLKTRQKGPATLTLHLDEQIPAAEVASIMNFHTKPVTIELLVDEPKMKENLGRISEEQRKKIFAIFEDVAGHTGNSKDAVKDALKDQFGQDTRHGPFSLATCPRETAGDFIEWLIEWCFENGVPLTDHPKEYFDDIEVYLALCIKKKLCCICGKPAEVHHWNAIGMGRDRRKYDDSDHRKMALCRGHHDEIEQIGRETFIKKYHVWGVLVTEGGELIAETN